MIPIVGALERELGKERAHSIVGRAIAESYAQWQVKTGSARNSHPREVNIEKQFPVETEVVEDTDSTFGINMTKCRFAEYFRTIGAADVGALLTCGVDFAAEAVLRPDWEFRAPKLSWVARAIVTSVGGCETQRNPDQRVTKREMCYRRYWRRRYKDPLTPVSRRGDFQVPYGHRMTTFALVHGAWHGAWCWELLTPLLQQEGHDIVTMDLPSDDGSASFETYADVVCAALDGYDDDVVLVGHSLAGSTVALVAARRPVHHLVYLCAVVPDIGRCVFDQFRDEPDMLNPIYVKGLSQPDAQTRTTWVDLNLARTLLCADCDDSTAKSALNRLRRQARYPSTVPFALSEFPRVSCSSVVCTEDQFVGPDWSRRVARDRLGAELIELPGSHSPFLSRPKALADVLLRLG